jgi:cyclic pyranopterin phosphate synthase
MAPSWRPGWRAKSAGLHRLNISLDSLRRDCVTSISGSDSLGKVLDGLAAAKAAGFASIKINMVPLAGVNDGDIESMLAYCMQQALSCA